MKETLEETQKIRSLEEALYQCQCRGMRISRQRRYILELLWKTQEHLSAREIYNRLSQNGKKRWSHLSVSKPRSLIKSRNYRMFRAV